MATRGLTERQAERFIDNVTAGGFGALSLKSLVNAALHGDDVLAEWLAEYEAELETEQE